MNPMTINLEYWYGENYPPLPQIDKFDQLLQTWHNIATTNNISYSIAYGTLLGWRRHRNYIPYDSDVDVMIGKDDIPRLFSLLKQPWCSLNCNNRWPFPGKFHLILLESHDKQAIDSARQRYNCQGEKVTRKIDACSFNGPIGRLITSNKAPYIDMYVYHKASSQEEVNTLEESGDCVEPSGLYCTFINSKIALPLPPVSSCQINGITTSSFIDPEPMLSVHYGKHFLKPDYLWIDGEWTKT
jgi:hypothetical protein